MKKKICLVTPGHIASNPRIVKEADALHEAGYDVTVIYTETTERVKNLDITVLQNSGWNYKKVTLGSKVKRGYRKVVHNISHFITNIKIPNTYFAKISHNSFYHLLNKAVLEHKADLYIGHNLPSLPIVYNASKKYSAKYGFDAEDYHKGEDIDYNEYLLRDYLESEFLPGASYLTASSPLIKEKYHTDYHVEMETILNVFPMQNDIKINNNTDVQTPSLYWFSQTIGPKRGLENILEILSHMKNWCNLYLRGSKQIDKDFINKLNQLSCKLGIQDKIHYLDSEPPSMMVELACKYDFGLSIEPGINKNNNLCLGNKIFTYLLAGIPVILSKTEAQTEIYKDIQDAALLVDLMAPEITAAKIDEVINNKQLLFEMKSAAKEYANNKYNWDIEKKKFLSIIEKTLN